MVASYLAKNKVNWPAIVDTNRQFEKTVFKNPISLSNTWQNYAIDAKGNFISVGSSGLKQQLERVVAGASWNVEPSEISKDLQGAWHAVEFGNFSNASKAIQKGLKSRKEETKVSAEKLNEFVQSKLTPAAANAASLKESQKEWEAYKAYAELEAKFTGYFDESLNVKEIVKELKSSENVKLELAALKQLQNASRAAEKSGFAKATGRLEQLIKKYPDTEAARTAQTLLDQHSSK